jgi:hypothetical protein
MFPRVHYILDYCLEGRIPAPVSFEDREYHVVDHILAFSSLGTRPGRIMAGVGVREMKERGNPWLHRLTPEALDAYRWFMTEVCGQPAA